MADSAKQSCFPNTTDTYKAGGPWDPEARAAACSWGRHVWKLALRTLGADVMECKHCGVRCVR